jgi:hypothetical protein
MSDPRNADSVVDLQRERERLRSSERSTVASIDYGGGGPHDPGMEARVARLEQDMQEIKTDLKAVRSDLSDIKIKLAGLDGRFAGLEGRLGALPTSLQLLGFAVAVFLAAGVFRFFEPRMFPAGPPQPAVTQPR